VGRAGKQLLLDARMFKRVNQPVTSAFCRRSGLHSPSERGIMKSACGRPSYKKNGIAIAVIASCISRVRRNQLVRVLHIDREKMTIVTDTRMRRPGDTPPRYRDLGHERQRTIPETLVGCQGFPRLFVIPATAPSKAACHWRCCGLLGRHVIPTQEGSPTMDGFWPPSIHPLLGRYVPCQPVPRVAREDRGKGTLQTGRPC